MRRLPAPPSERPPLKPHARTLNHIRSSIFGVLIAPLLAAQSNPEPFRVQSSSSGATYFEINAIRDSANGAGHSYCGFRTAGGDSVFELGWFYRVSGETRNHAFNDAPGVQVMTTPLTYFSGPPAVGLNLDTMSIDWDDVDGKGFDADWDVAVSDLGPDRATARHAMTITNPGPTAIDLELFVYIDSDVSGFYDLDNRASPSGGFLVLDSFGPSFVHVEPIPAPTHWEVDTFFNDLDGRMLSGSAYDLANTGLPFAADDWTGAFQWHVSIGSGASETISITVGRNVCANPTGVGASLTRYGTASTRAAGPLRLESTMPLLGSTYRVYVGNGPANGSISLMLGGQAIAAPYCGIELLVNPWTTVGIPLDPVGSGSLPISIYCDVNLAGIEIFSQAFAIDATGPSPCLPLVHSDALHAVIGG